MNWLEIFPEIGWIKDEGLRGKVIEVWDEAVRRRGWSEADLREMPFTLMLEGRQPDLIEHTRAVTGMARHAGETMAEHLGRKASLNMDALIAGALLHDVGKLFEFEREGDRFVKSPEGKLMRHPAAGAALAFELGLPPLVQHIIAYHSHEGDRVARSPEAVIVFHADFTFFDSLRAV